MENKKTSVDATGRQRDENGKFLKSNTTAKRSTKRSSTTPAPKINKPTGKEEKKSKLRRLDPNTSFSKKVAAYMQTKEIRPRLDASMLLSETKKRVFWDRKFNGDDNPIRGIVRTEADLVSKISKLDDKHLHSLIIEDITKISNNICFKNLEISDCVFRNVNFSGVDFSNVRVAEVYFYNCDFSGATFPKLIQNSVILNCKGDADTIMDDVCVYRTDVSGLVLKDNSMTGSRFSKCNIINSYWKGVDISGSFLFATEFRHTELKELVIDSEIYLEKIKIEKDCEGITSVTGPDGIQMYFLDLKNSAKPFMYTDREIKNNQLLV